MVFANLEEQEPRSPRIQAADPHDQRHHDVWQHGHLAKAHEAIGRELKNRSPLAKEQPCRDAETETD